MSKSISYKELDNIIQMFKDKGVEVIKHPFSNNKHLTITGDILTAHFYPTTNTINVPPQIPKNGTKKRKGFSVKGREFNDAFNHLISIVNIGH